MNIKDVIKDNFVKFSHACEGVLYYKVDVDGKTYEFPVDMNNKQDVGNGVFLKEDKAIYFLRWIRRSIDNDKFIQVK